MSDDELKNRVQRLENQLQQLIRGSAGVNAFPALTRIGKDMQVNGKINAQTLDVTQMLLLSTATTPATPESNKAALYLEPTKEMLAFVNDQGVAVPACVGRYNLDFLSARITGATSTTVGAYIQAWNFRDATTDIADWNLAVPPGWGGKAFVIDFWWAPSTTGSGNISVNAEVRRVSHGVTVGDTAGSTIQSAAAGVVDRIVKGSIGPMTMYDEGQAVAIRIYRSGAYVLDTYTGNAKMIVAQLRLI